MCVSCYRSARRQQHVCLCVCRLWRTCNRGELWRWILRVGRRRKRSNPLTPPSCWLRGIERERGESWTMQRRLVARRAISGCGPLTIHFPPLYSSAGAAVDDDDEDHQELRSFSLCPSRLEILFFFFFFFVFFFIFLLLFDSPSLQLAILFFLLFFMDALSPVVCSKGIWSQSISGPCQENELDLPSLSPLFWKFCVY